MNTLIVSFPWKLRLKQHSSNSVETDTLDTSSNTPKTWSRSTVYRRTLKQKNPEKAKAQKETDRKRWHLRKLNESTSQDDIHVDARRRKWAAQKKIQRKKKSVSAKSTDHHACESHVKKRLRDMSPGEKREYWRIRRQMSRESRSRQKVKSDRMSDTVRKAAERTKGTDHTPDHLTPVDETTLRSRQSTSRSTVYRKVNLIKKHMAESPRTYANIVDKLMTYTTPKKRAELERRRLKRKLYNEDKVDPINDGIKLIIEDAKISKDDKKRRSYYELASAARKGKLTYRHAMSLGISKHIYHRVIAGKNSQRKIRNDHLGQTVKDKVINFWFGASREYPCKKRVKKNRSIFVLTSTYISVYEDFKRRHPETKIGFIKFLQLRPSNVRKLQVSERNVCCCPKCENAKFIVQAMNQACRKNHLGNLQLKGEKDLADLNLCAYNEHPNPTCLDGSCESCANKVKSHYQPLVEKAAHQAMEYNKWQTVHTEKTVRDGKGGKKPKICASTDLVTHTTTVNDIVEMTVNEVNSLCNHLFRARWQQSQFSDAKDVMPPRSAVMVIDFAQNYACSFQDEVQSAHWSQNQVTIHSMVAYTNISNAESSATHIVNMVAISPDLKHDTTAVAIYCDLACTHLKDEYGVTKVIQYSDCCASQYRGKGSFADISLSPDVERHYFESYHGKSAADGLSAVVKHSVTHAVTHRKALVRNAKEFFNYCKEHLTDVGTGAAFPSQKALTRNSTRKFFFVEYINRERPLPETKTVNGTRKIHAVRSTGQPYQIQSRQLSCFCVFCTKGEGTVCTNKLYVGTWTTHKLQLSKGTIY